MLASSKKDLGERFYIQSASLNGKPYNRSFLDHFDIMRGGLLSFEMGRKYSGFGNKDYPLTEINDDWIVLNPIIEGGRFHLKEERMSSYLLLKKR